MVADGSGFAPDDIAALQVRYEILYYQFGKNAQSEDVDGCTAFAVLPEASAVIVTTGDPRFTFGPPPSDELPEDWRPALDLVRRHIVDALR